MWGLPVLGAGRASTLLSVTSHPCPCCLHHKLPFLHTLLLLLGAEAQQQIEDIGAVDLGP